MVLGELLEHAFVRRIPVLLRFVVALLCGYALAYAVLAPLWPYWTNVDSLRPVLLGSLVTMFVFYILFPDSSRVDAEQEGEQ